MAIVIIDDNQPAAINYRDRSFNYGDGTFTTLVSRGGRIELKQYHLQRLQQACQVLAIVGVDWPQLANQLDSLASELPQVIKVLISRGQGGRGYSPANLTADVYVSRAPFPLHYVAWRQTGIGLGVSTIPLGLNPLLAGIKHCNRLEQVLIKAQTEAQGFVDALVCDLNGMLVESVVGNVFWAIDGQWYTPLLDQAGVDGVMKRFILAKLPQLQHTQRVKAPLSVIGQAQSLFICNSLMGIMPVHSVSHGDQYYSFDVAVSQQLSGLVDGLVDGLVSSPSNETTDENPYE